MSKQEEKKPDIPSHKSNSKENVKEKSIDCIAYVYASSLSEGILYDETLCEVDGNIFYDSLYKKK